MANAEARFQEVHTAFVEFYDSYTHLAKPETTDDTLQLMIDIRSYEKKLCLANKYTESSLEDKYTLKKLLFEFSKTHGLERVFVTNATSPRRLREAEKDQTTLCYHVTLGNLSADLALVEVKRNLLYLSFLGNKEFLVLKDVNPEAKNEVQKFANKHGMRFGYIKTNQSENKDLAIVLDKSVRKFAAKKDSFESGLISDKWNMFEEIKEECT